MFERSDSPKPWKHVVEDGGVDVVDATGALVARIHGGSREQDELLGRLVVAADDLLEVVRRARRMHSVRCQCALCGEADKLMEQLEGKAP